MKRYGRSMLSEDQVKWIVNAKLEGKLTTGKLQACKVYQPEVCNSFTANTKVQGLFIFIKRLEGINSLCLRALRMKSLSFYKMYRANASYIGKILRAKGYSIDNNRINQILKEGLAMSEPKKWHKKKMQKNILILAR
ncbi:MAG: hypothetical protein RXR51_08440 [Nitrososphaeria archaeon]